MAIWQWGLLGLGLVWAIQAVGVWLQMRHYADVFKGITNQFKDGFVGAGHARGRLKKGAIAMIVIGPDLLVQRVLTMSGRSVFAKFQRRQEFEGISLDALKHAQKRDSHDCLDAAIASAIAQVETARARQIERQTQNCLTA